MQASHSRVFTQNSDDIMRFRAILLYVGPICEPEITSPRCHSQRSTFNRNFIPHPPDHVFLLYRFRAQRRLLSAPNIPPRSPGPFQRTCTYSSPSFSGNDSGTRFRPYSTICQSSRSSSSTWPIVANGFVQSMFLIAAVKPSGLSQGLCVTNSSR